MLKEGRFLSLGTGLWCDLEIKSSFEIKSGIGTIADFDGGTASDDNDRDPASVFYRVRGAAFQYVYAMRGTPFPNVPGGARFLRKRGSVISLPRPQNMAFP